MFFFFNDTATTEIYTLSLHDALPICRPAGAHLATPERRRRRGRVAAADRTDHRRRPRPGRDRRTGARSESTRLNSSHANISYAVFCLKKKKKHNLSEFIEQCDNIHVL